MGAGLRRITQSKIDPTCLWRQTVIKLQSPQLVRFYE